MMELLQRTTPLILDGATGMNLQKAGMPAGVCPEAWVLEHPHVLQSLQRAFVEAGSQAVYAPTFGANRVKLKKYGLESQLAEMNRALVRCSREAVGETVAVGGDLTSLGLFIEPFGTATFEEVVEIYREQAEALESAGVDFFIVETVMQLFEARAALLAIRSVSEKPVFVTVTVEENGRMLGGTDPLAALITLQGMGADAFGINCSNGPEAILAIIRRLAPFAQIPLIAKPNAGMPCVEADGSAHYHMSPAEFAADAEAFPEAGVWYVGGCCGTEPSHIRALADRVRNCPLVAPCASVTVAAASEKDAFAAETLPKLKPSENAETDLYDAIADCEADDGEVVFFAINSESDAADFAENQYLLKNPVCLIGDDAALLSRVLRTYHGRAYVSTPDTAAAAELARTYGAIAL